LLRLAGTPASCWSRVYHRDVTPRNILIQEQSGKLGPQFGLVDFGLAVNASKWRSQAEGSGDLGGDGRYWPSSAWFVFGYGTHALQKHPAMFHEYRTCLDVHSLGLTALRTLMEMMPPLESDWDIPGAECAVPKLKALSATWARCWSNSRRFWQPVFDAFRGAGDFETLRAAYINSGVHRIVAQDLNNVRDALQDARRACRCMPAASGLAGMPALFDALLLMLQAAREGEPKASQSRAPTAQPQRSENSAFRTPPPAARPTEIQDPKFRLQRWPSVSTATPDCSPSSASLGNECDEDGSTTTASERSSPRTGSKDFSSRDPLSRMPQTPSRLSQAWGTELSKGTAAPPMLRSSYPHFGAPRV